MASKFIQLNQLEELTKDTLKSSDYLLASTKIDDLNTFAKIGISEFEEYLNVSKIQKLNIQSTYYPYLYQIYFNDYDYSTGISAFESYRIPTCILKDLPIQYSSANPGGCVSIHKDNFVGHNVDRIYDESVNFIVTIPPKFTLDSGNNLVISRHGSISMSTGFTRLTKSVVDSKKYCGDYELVPFYATDGMNDSGLAITMDALPSGDDPDFDGSQYITTGTNPLADKDLCALMVTRVLLDKCSSIDDCLTELNSWNVWAPCIPVFNYEYAWTITDNTGRVIRLEIINNEFKVIEVDRALSKPNVSSNFYLWKYDGNIDDILIQDTSIDNPINNTLTDHSRGLERYYNTKIEVDAFEVLTKSSDLFTIFRSSYYSDAYKVGTRPIRCSDFCYNWGDPYGNLTIHNSLNDFNSIIDDYRLKYEAQDNYPFMRLGTITTTPYTVVYDLSNMTLEIMCDECYDQILKFKLAIASFSRD